MAGSPSVQASGSGQQHRALQKAISWESPKTTSNASLMISAAAGSSGTMVPGVSGGETSRGVSLDGIVTEYLMNQHALCKAPMVLIIFKLYS